MTCSLLRSRTAVTVVVQDSPSFDCTVMCASTSSEGRAEVSEDRQPPFHRSVRLLSAPLRGAVPSLPAGINTDDSDPLGPDRGTVLSAAIGAGRNPRFGGVAIVSRIFLYQHAGSRLVGTNHRKQKTSRNVGPVRPHAFFRYTPHFVPVPKNKRPPVPRKAPQIRSSNRLRKPGCQERRIVVNRDSFHDLGFQKNRSPLLSGHPGKMRSHGA